MRKILFRGKHIHALTQNKHLDGIWVYGYLCNENYINSPELEGEILVDPETVCQYTGLTDKEGKKIFEGDIIPYHFNKSLIGIVRYGEYSNPFNEDGHGGHIGFYVDWGKEKDKTRADLGYWIKVSEVIGNIFDKPELQESEEEE